MSSYIENISDNKKKNDLSVLRQIELILCLFQKHWFKVIYQPILRLNAIYDIDFSWFQ